MEALTSIVFHGLAYAMILYIISVGLSVTMGLMGFVNLAHGVFAMARGDVTVTLMTRYPRAFSLAHAHTPPAWMAPTNWNRCCSPSASSSWPASWYAISGARCRSQ